MDSAHSELWQFLGLSHWLCDRQGRFALTPSELYSLLGHNSQEFESDPKTLLDLAAPEDRESLRLLLNRLESGQIQASTVSHGLLRANGSILQVISRVVATPEGLLVGMSMEAGSTSRIPETVTAERDQLYRLLDRIPALVCLLNQNYELRFTNRAFRQQFGDPDRRPCHYALAGSKTPCPVCPALEAIKTNSPSVWEKDIAAQDRTLQMFAYPFVDHQGESLSLLVGMDITGLRRIQRALTASEQRYHSITENLTLGIAVLDSSYKITAVNSRLKEWFPSLAFDLQPGFPKAFPWTILPNRPNPIRSALEHREVHEATYQGPVPDKHYRILCCPVPAKTGEPPSLMVIFEDVSERLKVERRLERARKVEAMSALATGVAHEINQPLNALQLYASGLELLLEQKQPLDTETLMARLKLILGEADSIRDIVTHMRALVRQEEGKDSGPVDLSKAMERSLSLMGAQLSAHGIEVILALPEQLPMIQANAVQLEQVIINLLVNAMQALDQSAVSRKLLSISAERRDESVELTVADNGPGLDGKDDSIFEPFFSTKEAGMGLGLTIVHTFVDSWNGQVHFGPSNLGGAAFLVSLPVCQTQEK